MNTTYLRYLRSPTWATLRAQVLARDEYRCQVWLGHDATEVHHRTYERFGHEDLRDLISLCRSCHEAITNLVRAERHRARQLAVTPVHRLTPLLLRAVHDSALACEPVRRLTPIVERIEDGLQKLVVSAPKRITPVDAPRRLS